MKKGFWTTTLLLAGVLVAAPGVWGAGKAPAPTGQQLIEKQVHHELVMLPFYSLFDNFVYRVEGNQVTLMGQVTRPTLKSDAERVVRRIPGVAMVNNEIEVLPLSHFDDQIRRAELRAIFSQPMLQKYGWGTLPSIHIIVRNGDVTLEGVVTNQTDKNVAFLQANGVPGVFSVINNLRVL